MFLASLDSIIHWSYVFIIYLDWPLWRDFVPSNPLSHNYTYISSIALENDKLLYLNNEKLITFSLVAVRHLFIHY